MTAAVTTRRSLTGRVVVLVAVVLVTALGAVLLATALGGEDTLGGDHRRVDSLERIEGRWVAVNDAGAPAALVAPVSLRVEDGRLSFHDGCNGGGSTVRVEDSRLVLPDGGPAVSLKGCTDDKVREQGSWVLEMLTGRPRLEVAGPTLALHWGDGERYWLGFEREPVGAGS